MTQFAGPIVDVEDGNWTPTPAASPGEQNPRSNRLNKLAVNDSNYVTSGNDPNPDILKVEMQPLAFPGGGTHTLRVRLKKTASDPYSLIATLLQRTQGGGTVIASRALRPSTSYETREITLSQSEVALITNHLELDLELKAILGSSPPITGLFSTGVDSNSLPLVDCVNDSHWEVKKESAASYATAKSVVGTNIYWNFVRDGLSTWISNICTGLEADTSDWLFKTTFDVPSGLSSPKLSGVYMADDGQPEDADGTVDFILNGNNVIVGQYASFHNWTSFTISTGFQTGTNTLIIRVHNASGSVAMGLRVAFF